MTARPSFEADRHYDAIHSYFVRRTDPASTQDLTAEVFLVAWRRIDDVPRGEETLLWLYGVAANVALTSAVVWPAMPG